MPSPFRLLLAAALLPVTLALHAQPSNDDCSGATLLTVGANPVCDNFTAGTTLNATYSGVDYCGMSSPDVWYKFVATASAHTLSVANAVDAVGAPVYFQIEVFSGNCSGLVHSLCTNWYYQEGSHSIGDFVPGDICYFRISSPQQGLTFNFDICVGTPSAPPANDACTGAIVLSVDPDTDCEAPASGVTTGATASPVTSCNTCVAFYDVWYSFTATQANHTISLSNIRQELNPDVTEYAEFILFSGTCDNLTFVRAGGFFGEGSDVLSNLDPGETYFLRVAGSNYNSFITFDLCITSPPPPPNDACAGSLPLNISPDLYCYETYYGSTYLASSSGNNCQGGESIDVWLYFVATAAAHRVQLWASAGDDAGLEAYGGSCANPVSLACASGYDPALTLNNLVPGETYYIRVFGPATYWLNFGVCVQTLPPPPSNDECIDAGVLSVNADSGCGLTVNGSTLGATSSRQNCAETQATHDVWYSFTALSDRQRVVVTPNITVLGNYIQFGYEVLEGACGTPVSLVCKDLSNDYSPVTLSGLTPGATYFIRAYSENGSAHEFSVCVSTVPPPPPNADCATALEITPATGSDCDVLTAGTTAGVEAPASSYCYYGMNVWYEFTATYEAHILRISDVQNVYGNGVYYVETYSATDCGDLAIMRCDAFAGNVYLDNLVPGQKYYIRWVSESFGVQNFNICIGSAVPPANDVCAGASVLPVDADLDCDAATPGTTFGATFTSNPAGCFNADDVWYRFTATQAAHVISLADVLDAVYNYPQYFSLELLSANCSDPQSLYCWSANYYNNGTVTAGDLIPGQDYLIRVTNLYGTAINFNICVLTPPPPPANDACADAILLPAEPGTECATPTTGTTQYATISQGIDGSTGDVWYSFVATQANHNILISDVIDADYGYQSYANVSVYESACDTFILKHTAGIPSNVSMYVTNLVAGTTYHIRISALYTYAINFELCVTTPPPPPNDECATALPLPVSENLDCTNNLVAQNFGATQSLPACNGEASNDIWYQFTAASSTYRIEITAYGISNGWGYEVFSGDCNALTSMFCYMPYYASNFNLENLSVGTTYYLRLFSVQNQSNEFLVCTRALPPPPANDDCAAAIPLTVDPDMICDAPQTGTTVSATGPQLSCTGNQIRDVWYSFVATGVTQLLDITATAGYFGGNNYNLGFEVIGGDCDSPASVICQEYLFQNLFVIPNLTPGATYYLRVYSFNDYAHDFSVCLMTLPPPPANDQCEFATQVSPNEGLVCDLVYSGTTLGATASLNSYQMDVWFEFVATSTFHVLEFSNLTAALGYPYPVYFNIYQGACNNLSLITSYSAEYPALIDYLQAGETYFIQVYPGNQHTAVSFDFCIKTLPPSPPNETCAGAYELTPNTGLDCDITTSGSTAGAATVDFNNCGYGNDIWYKFVATSPNHQVQANNITPLLGSGSFTTGVFQGSDCNNIGAISCAYGDQIIYLSGLTTGATYYVRVSSDYGSVHAFDLCVRTIPPPPNDLCINAIPLDIDEDQSCDNFISGTSAGSGPSGISSACSYDLPDVWYSFTATQAAHTISLNNMTDPLYGYPIYCALEVFAGACSGLQNIACRQNLYYSDFFTIGELVPGQVYYVRVLTNNTNGVNFDLCVGTPPPPPLNDACINAQTLPVASGPVCETPTAGTLQNATPNPGDPYYGYGIQYNDVWYSFTATGSNHVVELSNLSYPANLNMQVLSGTCGALTSLGVQNTYYSNQLLLTHLVAGNTYYIRILETDNQPISFDICVLSLPQPPNDECVGATELIPEEGLGCAAYTAGSTYGATQSQPGCYEINANDIWYRFVATGTSHLVSIDASGGSGYYSLFGLEVFEGSCEGLLPLLPCEYFSFSGNLSRLLQNLVAGNTYYIRLFAGQNDFKNFNLCIQTLPEPPANNECAQAIDIQANEDLNCTLIYTGTTLGATQSAPACYGANVHDVWYRFAATSATQLINLAAITPLLSDGFLGLEVYSGDACDNLQSLHCDQYASNNSTIVGGLTEGSFYYIRVFSFYGSAHDFSLCIRTLPPPPANENCADAQVVTPSPDMTCTYPATGFSSGLSDYNYIGCTYGPDVWYQFTATSNAHLVQLQNVQIIYGNSFMALELYQGDNCEQLSLLNCSYGGSEIYASSLVTGNTYYIRVVGNPYSGTGFDLCVLTVPPAANDFCSTAIMLPVASGTQCETATPGTTLGATYSAEPVIGYCNPGVDVWYSFVAGSTAHIVTLSNFLPYYGGSQVYYEILSGDCESWTSLGCYQGYASPTLTELVPGQTYYIHLGVYGTEYFNFDICVTTALPDMGGYAVYPLSNGCGAGSSEAVDAYFVNQGSLVVPAGAAVFELEVTSPAGSSVYGPVTNTEPIYPGYISYASFTGVDLSVPGVYLIRGIVSVADDSNAANDTLGAIFYSTPLDTFYLDSDLDGYGDANNFIVSCFQYEGYSINSGDCNDADAGIHPGATEFCNGYDDDCDGLTDGADPGIIDTLPPTISCPANVLASNDSGLCSAIVEYDAVGASDDCSYTLEQTAGLASGQVFPVGTTINTFLATDAGGNSVSCSFSVEVQKSADPDLLYAYTVIGFKEVQLRKNTVASGGVGVTNANKKAILQSNTTVTAPNTFVKSPDMQLQSGSQVTTWYQGQTDAGLLPAFQPNNNPGNNNVTIANNSAPVTLNLANYGKITVGNNVIVTFSGHALVRIKDLQVGNDATILFAQGTQVLIDKKMTIGKRTDINPGGGQAVQFFAEGEVSIDRGCDVTLDLLYTQKTLDVLQATASQPTLMTGLFVAEKVNAKEYVTWNTDASYCPLEIESRALAGAERTQQPGIVTPTGKLTLSPNPTSGEVYLAMDWPLEATLTITVNDATGRLIRTEKTAAPAAAGRYRLGLEGLSEGVYTVQVTDGLRRESGKLVIVR